MSRVFLLVALILALACNAEVRFQGFLWKFWCCFCALTLIRFYPLFVPKQAFAPRAFFVKPALVPSTTLFACRTNAKKEKRQRNRENMRKFATPGRKGLSKRKLLKKAQAAKARQSEAEFIAKCFITDQGPEEAPKE